MHNSFQFVMIIYWYMQMIFSMFYGKKFQLQFKNITIKLINWGENTISSHFGLWVGKVIQEKLVHPYFIR